MTRASFDVMVEQNLRNPFVKIDAFINENIPSIIEIGNLDRNKEYDFERSFFKFTMV